MPTVLIAIPVYNGAHFLPQTLDCIAAQTRRPDRIVVIDNASTDATPDIIRAYGRLNIEYRRNATNVGGAANLNLCLQLAAETEFLHLLMADDLVRPTFTERSLGALGDITGQALSYVLDDKINQHGRIVLPAATTPGARVRTVPPAEFIRRQATLETVMLPGVLFKTDRRPIPPRFANFPQVADGVFLAECSHSGFTVVEVPEALCEYRLSEINASSRHRTQIESFVRDEWRAMSIVAGWIPEPAWRRPITRALLRLRFSARTEVKRQLFAAANPEYAREVDAVRREIGGLLLGTAGVAAVRARDLVRRLQGQPTRLQEFERLQDAGKP